MDRDQAIIMVTYVVSQVVLNMCQPPPSLSPDLQDTLSVPKDTLYQVTTKETSQYANSTVSDLTLHTLQRQMDMM